MSGVKEPRLSLIFNLLPLGKLSYVTLTGGRKLYFFKYFFNMIMHLYAFKLDQSDLSYSIRLLLIFNLLPCFNWLFWNRVIVIESSYFIIYAPFQSLKGKHTSSRIFVLFIPLWCIKMQRPLTLSLLLWWNYNLTKSAACNILIIHNQSE